VNGHHSSFLSGKGAAMKVFLFVIALVSLSLGSSAKADFIVASNFAAGQVYTQAWEEVGLIAPKYNNVNNSAVGQTFIPQSNAKLTEVDALISAGYQHPVANSPPLRVSIATSMAGIPITNVATLELPATRFSSFFNSTNCRETFDFSAFGIDLVAGNEYMVLFQTPFGVTAPDTAVLNFTPYFVGFPQAFLGIVGSGASDGTNWQRYPGIKELAIEVRAVPEPSTFTMLVVCGIGVCVPSLYQCRTRRFRS
jgi:hypothetical protein